MTLRRVQHVAATIILALVVQACRSGPGGPGTHSVASADEVPIAYDVTGDGSTMLVFVHGWTCDRTYWREQVTAFSADYRVVTLDLAGHGASGTGRADWSIQQFAQDVAAVVRAVDAKSVILVGHSLGGPVVLEAGLLLPEQVEAVIGIDTFFDAWTDPAVAQAVNGLRGDFRARVRPLVRDGMFTPESPASLADSVADAMSSARPEMALPAIEGLLNWAKQRAPTSIPALQAPIGVIMAGGYKQTTTAFEQHRGQRPLLAIEQMPGLGHFPMREAPAAFNDHLRRMLARIPRRKSA